MVKELPSLSCTVVQSPRPTRNDPHSPLARASGEYGDQRSGSDASPTLKSVAMIIGLSHDVESHAKSKQHADKSSTTRKLSFFIFGAEVGVPLTQKKHVTELKKVTFHLGGPL